MTTATTEPAPTRLPKFLANEPWGIWAGVLAVIIALVVSVLTFGVAGLVVVMAPAALAMVALLSLIVFG
ncbi:MAG: hypothetical protein EA339_14785 [Rhodobacteraceae bacterium]|nr:MAG: hypothetical protein EA339_14785 [Paracoccaceae bacterium]